MTKFNTLASALNFRNHSITPSKWTIIMGSDFLYWFVTNREASILVKQGFEIAD